MAQMATGRIIYVDTDAIGADDGSSWENAYTFLQDALADANSAVKPVEIRLAKGTYKPDQDEAGVDLTLIRWMLTLSPAERVAHIESVADSLTELRELNRER